MSANDNLKPAIAAAAAALCLMASHSALAAAQCAATLATSLPVPSQTTVILAHLFKQGEDLNLNGSASGVVASQDLCMVKLLVGPGNPGPSSAPSTSRGIGIEIWLPSDSRWNGRIHATGGGGYAGTPGVTSTTELGTAQVDHFAAAFIADHEGAVSALTDTGHIGAGANGDFGLTPEGRINGPLWEDFSRRAVHQMSLYAKALTVAYYGKPAQHAYFEGCSLGGRQGHKEAQDFPGDYNGILVGNGALNWTRFITAELYGQVVTQQDLGGRPLTAEQLQLVSSAAVSACDTDLTGHHEGYITRPAMCRYDPTKDKNVICRQDGGSNGSPACVNHRQADVLNKVWYGQTEDGSVPSPAHSIGAAPSLDPKQLWYGLARGTGLGELSSLMPGLPGLLYSKDGTPIPFPIAPSQIAIDLQNSRLAMRDFRNARGDGADGWKALSYLNLSQAQAEGLKLQADLSNVNTDSPNLSAFRDSGGKMLHYYGLADQLIPFPGAAQYYERVASAMGGVSSVQQFYQLLPIPGMGHCFGVGSVNGIAGVSPPADPPMPAPDQLYDALTHWVELAQAPTNIVVHDAKNRVGHPLCAYPQTLVYRGGDATSAANYSCKVGRQ